MARTLSVGHHSASGSRFDMKPIFSHPGFLSTSFIAIVGWWTAFVGQVVLEKKYQEYVPALPGSGVGVEWFGIFLELFVIIGVFVALGTDSVARHRFQLSIFLSIAVVYSVLGVNTGIFTRTSYQLAIGAGWLLLSIVNLIWLLYFTSEEDALFLRLFDAGTSVSFTRSSMSSGALSHHNNSNNNNGGVASSGNRRAVAGGVNPAQRSNSALAMSNAYASGHSHGGYGGGVGGVGSKSGGSIGGHGPSGLSVQDHSVGGHESTHMASPSVHTTGGTGSIINGGGNEEHLLKARALYSYTASPDDPNEISFTKGEILDILDNSGKWWQGRKADGTKGILPSNYMALI